jgi:Protein of unknown function (DUF3631)
MPDDPFTELATGLTGDGAALLENIVGFVQRFVVLTETQVDAIALWIVHTHAFAAADTTAYLWIASAEKRSGKTRLLEVLELLARTPLPTANISDAALFRAITELKPTLLLDEVDAIFGTKARDREDLRGMLNAGYKRGAVARRMGGARMTTLEEFPVFCAKALAGIGKLPDTITDRAILIRLLRKTREEQVERFRRRDVAPQAEALRNQVVAWTEPQLDQLRAARPDLPDEIDDRAQDIWEPLFAIADLAGGGWSARARTAALTLSGGEEREDESVTARLLADIYTVFEANGDDERLKTADLIKRLCEIEESPWGDWYGKPITAHGLSRLLQPHRIKTMPVWVDGKTVRGYKAEQFDEAFLRVLGVRSVRNVRSESASQAAPNTPNAPNASGTGESPLPGDDGFLDWIANGHRDGWITTEEALVRQRTHELVVLADRARGEDGRTPA